MYSEFLVETISGLTVFLTKNPGSTMVLRGFFDPGHQDNIVTSWLGHAMTTCLNSEDTFR